MVSALSTSKRSAGSLSTDTATAMQLAYWIAALLLASGCLHLAMFAMHGTTWHGPLSIRKPALFGISGGMTTWSIAWLMTQLRPQKFDSFLANSLAIGLLVEVALITLQYWRGVASHFNHSTTLDAAIEFTMLGLILFVCLEQSLQRPDVALATSNETGGQLLSYETPERSTVVLTSSVVSRLSNMLATNSRSAQPRSWTAH